MTEINTLIYGGAPLDEDTTVRYNEIKSLLSKHIAQVVFTKLDGSERTMTATLRADLLPEQKQVTESTEKKVNTTVLAAYDLEKRAWRSFRIENVRSVTGETE